MTHDSLKIPLDRRLQAVVFDLDGLMFNTEDLYQQTGSEVLKRRGKEVSDALIDQMMGRKSLEALQVMIDWHQLDDTAEGLAAESMEIMAQLIPTQLAPMPGLLALLATLEGADIPKGIATSSSPDFVTQVLGRFGLGPRFSFVLTSADIVHGKPAPDIYELAAARHHVSPAETMVLEDSQIGCRAAVAAGAYVVVVPSGKRVQYKYDGASLVAHSLADPRICEALGLESQA
ncbi:MAG: HAD-IA family hydrolase [Pirellulales bacterium]|nr:HAD-IA family hydrolase [Pirellulales bacterium]